MVYLQMCSVDWLETRPDKRKPITSESLRLKATNYNLAHPVYNHSLPSNVRLCSPTRERLIDVSCLNLSNKTAMNLVVDSNLKGYKQMFVLQHFEYQQDQLQTGYSMIRQHSNSFRTLSLNPIYHYTNKLNSTECTFKHFIAPKCIFYPPGRTLHTRRNLYIYS